MSILINSDTKVVVQGITGKEGSFHTHQMLMVGTKIVAGVTPRKGGTELYGIPVYDTVSNAVRIHHIDASVIFVPPEAAADAIMEAADSDIGLVVCITDGISVHDMIKVRQFLIGKKTMLIGPNCPGIISPGKSLLGIIPAYVYREGNIGIISRSGSLTYEVADQITTEGLGQSTCVGIGGDMVVGSNFVDILRLFKDDKETEAVVLIGEIGGSMEEDAAEFIKGEFKKPVFAYIAGKFAPSGKKMGHAGAIISGGKGSADSKIDALRDAGVEVIMNPSEIGKIVKKWKEQRHP